MYSCEKDSSDIIDPIISFPKIMDVFVTPGSFDTAYINPVLVAVVTSDEPVSNVNGRITNPLSVILGDVQLKDDGILPDTTAGDGHFTGQLSQLLDCKLVGNYKVEFTAQNISGVYGNTFIGNFGVTNINNNRPSVNFVISPDSLRRPSGIGGDSVNLAFLQMHPTDPDGVCDINLAYFFSFRPDGTITKPDQYFSFSKV